MISCLAFAKSLTDLYQVAFCREDCSHLKAPFQKAPLMYCAYELPRHMYITISPNHFQVSWNFPLCKLFKFSFVIVILSMECSDESLFLKNVKPLAKRWHCFCFTDFVCCSFILPPPNRNTKLKWKASVKSAWDFKGLVEKIPPCMLAHCEKSTRSVSEH